MKQDNRDKTVVVLRSVSQWCSCFVLWIQHTPFLHSGVFHVIWSHLCVLGSLCPLRSVWRSIRAPWTTSAWPATPKVQIQSHLTHRLIEVNKYQTQTLTCVCWTQQELCPACFTWLTSFMTTPEEESWPTPTVEVCTEDLEFRIYWIWKKPTSCTSFLLCLWSRWEL